MHNTKKSRKFVERDDNVMSTADPKLGDIRNLRPDLILEHPDGMRETVKEYLDKQETRWNRNQSKSDVLRSPMSHLPKGVTESPSGDIGQHRQIEAKVAGGFTGIKSVSASSYFKKGS